jgi:hypothetical protein
MKRSLYLPGGSRSPRSPGGSRRRFDAVAAVGAASPVNDAEIVLAVGATAPAAHPPPPALGAAAPVNDDEIVSAVGAAAINDAEIVPAVGAAAPAAHPPPPAVGAAAPVNDAEIVPAVGAAAPAAHPPDSDMDSDSDSGSEMSTDEEDDILHRYIVPVPSGPNLRVTYQPHFKSYRCPVCPGRKPKWPLEQQVRNHVVNQAKSMAARHFNKKKWCRHRKLARNHGWM